MGLEESKPTPTALLPFFLSFYRLLKNIQIKRIDDFDLGKFVMIVNGQEQGTGRVTQPEPLVLSGNVMISSPTFEPRLSCAINYSHEVVVRESIMASNTPINKANLKYLPTKFCSKDLGVIIFSAGGLTSSKGTITEAIAQGKDVYVREACTNTNELCVQAKYIQLFYITPYVSGMGERCTNVGEAYDYDTKKCVQIALQQIPTNTLLYCTKDTDCIIPQKCNDATVSCVSNQCAYQSAVCTPDQIINYITVIKTVEVPVPQVKIISTGVNDVRFMLSKATPSTTVAGQVFSSAMPSIVCSTSVWGPIVNDGCYQTTFNWAGYSKTIKNGETITLSPNLAVKYEYTGTPAKMLENSNKQLYLEFPETYYQNTFIVTFTNAFDLSLVSIPEKVKLGTTGQLQYKIKNNLFALPATITYTVKNLPLNTYETKAVTQTLSAGDNIITYSMNTPNLGGFVGEVSPSFNMNNNNAYVADEQLLFGTWVTDDTNLLTCNSGTCLNGVCISNNVCQITKQTNCNTGASCPSGSTCDTATGNCMTASACTDTFWTPLPSEKCSGQTFTQISNCQKSKTATGTMQPMCPAASTVCSGQPILPTNNCGTCSGTGTKDCSLPCTSTVWQPSTDTECSDKQVTQYLCNEQRTIPGTKDCSVNPPAEEDEEGFKMDNNMIIMIIIGVFALALIGGGRRR